MPTAAPATEARGPDACLAARAGRKAGVLLEFPKAATKKLGPGRRRDDNGCYQNRSIKT